MDSSNKSSLPNYPSQEVREFGERVSTALYDSDIRRAMGGLGGCKNYDPSDFDADLLPYIEAYFEGNHDSVAITYAAMRDKEMALQASPD